jgi:hypothetical protein
MSMTLEPRRDRRRPSRAKSISLYVVPDVVRTEEERDTAEPADSDTEMASSEYQLPRWGLYEDMVTGASRSDESCL